LFRQFSCTDGLGRKYLYLEHGTNYRNYICQSFGNHRIYSKRGSFGLPCSGESNRNGCTSAVVITQVVDLCTGVAGVAKQNIELNVFPNPFKNKITVVTNGEKQIIHVFNDTGAEIYTAISENEITEIDLHQEASGIYFIRIGSVTRKIVKE
jgi:hypothetical protein